MLSARVGEWDNGVELCCNGERSGRWPMANDHILNSSSSIPPLTLHCKEGGNATQCIVSK